MILPEMDPSRNITDEARSRNSPRISACTMASGRDPCGNTEMSLGRRCGSSCVSISAGNANAVNRNSRAGNFTWSMTIPWRILRTLAAALNSRLDLAEPNLVRGGGRFHCDREPRSDSNGPRTGYPLLMSRESEEGGSRDRAGEEAPGLYAAASGCRRAGCVGGESAAPELANCQRRRLEERAGGNLPSVTDAFAVGERDQAGAGGGHDGYLW